ncbi:cell wall-binding repeat-containing protein [Clostridium sp. OS1-26]|uniref:cell wall-binding repeat-containing protein n=1 Tax=Clostridium sp. OS1-26 TaxID=3070681 RepID=UPI0027DF43DF|nr:cell wall-binding repeat-containing protein [Clostridium sp. OS1-26]WML36689.1 cell wall-binding repeat-containing protein [Clostridium sp. OS1-26]
MLLSGLSVGTINVKADGVAPAPPDPNNITVKNYVAGLDDKVIVKGIQPGDVVTVYDQTTGAAITMGQATAGSDGVTEIIIPQLQTAQTIANNDEIYVTVTRGGAESDKVAKQFTEEPIPWHVYDHTGNWGEMNYPNGDNNPLGSAYNKHIIVANGGGRITFYGYGQPAYNDFIYLSSDDTNEKTFTFDMDISTLNFHSMQGAGVLFNAQITNGKISGYALLYTEDSKFTLYELNNADVNLLHDGNVNIENVSGVTQKSKFAPDTKNPHSLIIKTLPEKLNVSDNGKQIVTDFALPNAYGNGLGLIAAYKAHGCPILSYFTITNVKIKGVTYSWPILNLTAKRGNPGEGILNFSAPEGAESILLQQSTDGINFVNATTTSAITATSTTATVTGLDDHQRYFFRLLVGGGTSEGVSNVAYLSAPIIDLAATPGDTTANLTFTAPEGAKSVIVQQSTDGVNYTTSRTNLPVTQGSTSTTVTGLTNGKQYSFRLIVTGGAYDGTSNVATATLGAAYTITFDPQGGNAVTTSQSISDGGKVVKPADPTKEGKIFGGWYKENTCTNPWNFGNDTVTADTTLYAKWNINSYIVSGIVNDDVTPANPVSGAKVHIEFGGKNVSGPVDTDADGNFTLYDVPAGIYNLVIETTDVNGKPIIVTQIIQVTGNTQLGAIKLPVGRKSSKFLPTNGVPVNAVGKLDEVFNNVNSNSDDNLGVTLNDLDTVRNGGEVLVRLEAKPVDTVNQANQISNVNSAMYGDRKHSGYLVDISAYKDVTPLSGSTNTTQLKQLNNLVDVYITLPSEIQGKTGYVVYRHHEGAVNKITETPNGAGEKFRIINGDTLILSVQKFSVYAIAYDEQTSGGSGGSHGGSGGGSAGSSTEGSPVNGTVQDGKTEAAQIKATVKTEGDGTKTVSMKEAESILVKQADGSTLPLGNMPKVSVVGSNGTSVPVTGDGTLTFKGLQNGSDNNYKVYFDLGNGQKIIIGKVKITVSSNGTVGVASNLIDPYGLITDSVTGRPVAGAEVKLYYANTARNIANGKTPDTLVSLPAIDELKLNKNQNPQGSNALGAYGWMVFPKSDYYIAATKDGYYKYMSQTLSVDEELVKWDFKMNPQNASTQINGLNRFWGQDRIDTAIAIAKANFTGKVSNVVLAASSNFPDALSGSPLAYKLNAPIILVGDTEADQAKVINYIKENVDSTGKIYILGGYGVVTKAFEDKVTASGYSSVKRLGGADRYETSAKIAKELSVAENTPVIIASGENYPDALSISSIAAVNGYPILLVSKDSISDLIIEQLKIIKPGKVFIVGLQGAVGSAVESQIPQLLGKNADIITRIGGQNRYETSIEIAKYFNLAGNNVCIATGNSFPDAVAGSIYAAKHNSPVILVDRALTEAQKQYIIDRKTTGIAIFGGEGVVNKNIESQLSQIIAK